MMLHLRERLWSVTGHETEDSGAEISGGVDGVAAVEAEAHANGQHGEANEQGHQLSAYLVISMTVMKMMVMMANMDRHYLATHLVIIDDH